MENKQQVILELLREMLKMLHYLTFISPKNINKDTLKYIINKVRQRLDHFEDVFVKEDEQDEDKDDEKQGQICHSRRGL